jgi:hypothetical protein
MKRYTIKSPEVLECYRMAISGTEYENIVNRMRENHKGISLKDIRKIYEKALDLLDAKIQWIENL